MPNNITKEQHYIPQFYMKNFANKDKTFTIIDIKKSKSIQSIPYSSQFKEKYFYDRDNSIEKKLNQLETTWAKIIHNIIDGKYPTDYEKMQLKQFALYQRNRTYYRSEELFEISWQSRKLEMEMRFMNECKNLKDSDWEKLRESYKNSYYENPIKIALQLVEKHLDIINDLEVAIIKYSSNALISSDNPIIHYNNFDSKSVGYNNGGLVIFFPISSEMLCVIYDSKIYFKLDTTNFIICSNNYEVKFLNYYQILNAYNYIFFKDAKLSSNLLKELNKNKIKRLLQFSKLKTDILGSKTSKVISFHAKYIYLEHHFSFAKLTKRAMLVPKNAIDWFPRTYDEKYYNGVFKSRKETIPMLNKLKKEANLNDAILWSISEINIFNQFVIDYWNNELY